jgi:flagellar protein FlaF
VTPHALAKSAYAPQNTVTTDPKRMEFAAFTRVTKMLTQVQNGNRMPLGYKAAAMHDNRRLWIEIAALVADDDNKLPKDLRARLFYLAEFVEYHSTKVFSENASLQPLIDINSAIMSGLNAQQEAS